MRRLLQRLAYFQARTVSHAQAHSDRLKMVYFSGPTGVLRSRLMESFRLQGYANPITRKLPFLGQQDRRAMTRLWELIRFRAWRLVKVAVLLGLGIGLFIWIRFTPIVVTEHKVESGPIISEVMGTGTLEAARIGYD